MTKTEKALDDLLRSVAITPDPALQFAVKSGYLGLLLACFQAADDLHDVIEICRAQKNYRASDRLRVLQQRLYDAAEPLHRVAARPSRQHLDLIFKSQRAVAAGDL